jgi:hypothetical protein
MTEALDGVLGRVVGRDLGVGEPAARGARNLLAEPAGQNRASLLLEGVDHRIGALVDAVGHGGRVEDQDGIVAVVLEQDFEASGIALRVGIGGDVDRVVGRAGAG